MSSLLLHALARWPLSSVQSNIKERKCVSTYAIQVQKVTVESTILRHPISRFNFSKASYHSIQVIKTFYSRSNLKGILSIDFNYPGHIISRFHLSRHFTNRSSSIKGASLVHSIISRHPIVDQSFKLSGLLLSINQVISGHPISRSNFKGNSTVELSRAFYQSIQ